MKYIKILFMISVFLLLPQIVLADDTQSYIVEFEKKIDEFGILSEVEAFEQTKSSILSQISNSSIKNEFTRLTQGITVELTDNEYELLLDSDLVKAVHKNREVELFLEDIPNLLNLTQIWNKTINLSSCNENSSECLRGENISIGVIDTGVDYTHPDLGGCSNETFLAGNCSKVIGGHNFITNSSDPMDDDGHGTHVAAIAAGNGNLTGVAPEAKIYAYKVLNEFGSGTIDDIVAGLEKAVEDEVDIVIMSLGIVCEGSYDDDCGPDDILSSSVNAAVDEGLLVSVAAGNDGYNGTGWVASPGVAEKALTIGSHNKLFNLSSFSSYGPIFWDRNSTSQVLLKPDVIAPGEAICAALSNASLRTPNCFDDDKHLFLSGTSMATPVVAGLAALIKQRHNNWSVSEIKNTITQTSSQDRVNVSLFQQGFGNINPLDAISINVSPQTITLNTSNIIESVNASLSATFNGDSIVNHTLYAASINSYYDKDYNWSLLCSSNSSSLCNFNSLEQENGEYLLRVDATQNISENKTRINKDYSLMTINVTRFEVEQNYPLNSTFEVSSLSYPLELSFFKVEGENTTSPLNISEIKYVVSNQNSINLSSFIQNSSYFNGTIQLSNYSQLKTDLIIKPENQRMFNYSIYHNITTNFTQTNSFIGDKNAINTNLANLSFYTNESQNLSINYTNITSISLNQSNVSVDFSYEFTNTTSFNLTGLNVFSNELLNRSSLLLRDISNQSISNFTVSMPLSGNLSKMNSLCLYDSNSLLYSSQMNGNCSNSNEYYIHNVSNGSSYDLENSSFSNLEIEQEVNSSVISLLFNQSSSMSLGVSQVCTENWEFGEWSSCENGTQERELIDVNSCGTTFMKPEPQINESCEEEDSGDDGGDDSGDGGGDDSGDDGGDDSGDDGGDDSGDDGGDDSGDGGGSDSGSDSSNDDEFISEDDFEEIDDSDEEISDVEPISLSEDETPQEEKPQKEGKVITQESESSKISISVNGEKVTDSSYSGVQAVSISDSQTSHVLVDFNFNFSKTNLSISESDLEYDFANRSALVVTKHIEGVESKSLRIPRNYPEGTVCVRDSEISSMNELIFDCELDQGYEFDCSTQDNCFIDDNYYVIENLSHSAVYEIPPQEEEKSVPVFLQVLFLLTLIGVVIGLYVFSKKHFKREIITDTEFED